MIHVSAIYRATLTELTGISKYRVPNSIIFLYDVPCAGSGVHIALDNDLIKQIVNRAENRRFNIDAVA